MDHRHSAGSNSCLECKPQLRVTQIIIGAKVEVVYIYNSGRLEFPEKQQQRKADGCPAQLIIPPITIKVLREINPRIGDRTPSLDSIPN